MMTDSELFRHMARKMAKGLANAAFADVARFLGTPIYIEASGADPDRCTTVQQLQSYVFELSKRLRLQYYPLKGDPMWPAVKAIVCCIREAQKFERIQAEIERKTGLKIPARQLPAFIEFIEKHDA